jgi:hypothetical protein
MNDEILGTISSALSRIEGKLDTAAIQFDQHLTADAVVAADVRALRSQRGFILSGFAAVGVGIGAGMVYVVKRLLGSH